MGIQCGVELSFAVRLQVDLNAAFLVLIQRRSRDLNLLSAPVGILHFERPASPCLNTVVNLAVRAHCIRTKARAGVVDLKK